MDWKMVAKQAQEKGEKIKVVLTLEIELYPETVLEKFEGWESESGPCTEEECRKEGERVISDYVRDRVFNDSLSLATEVKVNGHEWELTF
jgi:hypothetical protein